MKRVFEVFDVKANRLLCEIRHIDLEAAIADAKRRFPAKEVFVCRKPAA